MTEAAQPRLGEGGSGSANTQGGVPQAVSVELLQDLSTLSPALWETWTAGHPLLSWQYLNALHDTGCASAATGWEPVYALVKQDRQPLGVIPLYLKTHSRGEYVFDQAWAAAFHQYGRPYYPKLVGASPFTPVSGPRLLASTLEGKQALAQALPEIAQALDVSSAHILFPNETDRRALQSAGLMIRHGVQFHWENAGYASYEDFLASLTRDKRKKMRQDSAKAEKAGVHFRCKQGAEISAADRDFFYECYVSTYYVRGREPYLSRDFFEQWWTAQPACWLLIQAWLDGQPFACALNVVGPEAVYGRYWGARGFIPGLHFETCYAQSIRWCIEHGIAGFEGGAQGEHKLSRGLLPRPTYSAHWIADPEFRTAIARYLAREEQGMMHYVDELLDHSPFKESPA